MITNRDIWEEGNPASWGTSPQYQVGDLLLFCPRQKIKISLFFVYELKSLLFSSSQEVHLHVLMKHLHLAQAGPILRVATIVKLEHQEITVLLMVIFFFLSLC